MVNKENDYSCNELKTEIDSIEEGYEFAEKIIQKYSEDYYLKLYCVAYSASEINTLQIPLYYEFIFEVENKDIAIRIDINKNLVEINKYSQSVFNEEVSVDPPNVKSILDLFIRTYGEDSISKIVQKDRECIICFAKVYKRSFSPNSDWWYVDIQNYSNSKTHPINYFSCMIDTVGEEVVDTN